MKKMKFLSALLACIMACSIFLFSGCKEEENSSGAGATEQETTLEETGFYMARNGQSDYKIVLPSTAGDQLLTAGDEMQYFLEEALGIKLDIVYDKGLKFNSNSQYISIGDNDLSKAAGVTCSEAEYGVSGYVIKTVGKSVFLVGGGNYGSQYAVYDFLAKTLHYELYALDEIYIDKTDELKLYDFNLAVKQQFEFTNFGFAEMAWWSGLSYRFHNMEAFIVPSTGAHSTFMYFPIEEYGDLHPEWYSADYSQMCYSSETLVDALAGKYIEELKAYSVEDVRGAKTFNWGLEDNDGWCRCTKCQASITKYGADSATMVLFINKVADKVQAWIDENQTGREVYFNVLAYHAPVAPPVDVDPNTGEATWVDDDIICRDNVAVRYAPISASFMYPLNDKQHNLNTYLEMKGWGAICKNISFYGYVANFSHTFVGLDTFNAIQENYRFFKECNVNFLTEQGYSFTMKAPGFTDFRLYMIHEWAMDTEQNFKDLKNDFFKAYYKDASDVMIKLFDEVRLHYQFLAEVYDIVGGCYEDLYNQNMWSQGTLEKWIGYIDEAYEAIEPLKNTNPELYQKLWDRINIESMQARFLLIHLYSSKAFTVTGLYEAKIKFIEDCQKYEVSPSEGGSVESLRQMWGV